MDDKWKVVRELQSAFLKCDELFIASDDDREGEAIGWHLCCALDVNPLKTKRIIFHEVTKKAIVKALKEPIVLNMNLVNAQQARRMLDRLIDINYHQFYGNIFQEVNPQEEFNL